MVNKSTAQVFFSVWSELAILSHAFTTHFNCSVSPCQQSTFISVNIHMYIHLRVYKGACFNTVWLPSLHTSYIKRNDTHTFPWICVCMHFWFEDGSICIWHVQHVRVAYLQCKITVFKNYELLKSNIILKLQF